MATKRILRTSTCLCLGLPADLTCRHRLQDLFVTIMKTKRSRKLATHTKHMLTTVKEMLQELKSIAGHKESQKKNKESFRDYFADKRLESALEKFAEKKFV